LIANERVKKKKDVGAAVVGGMESNFGRAILWRKILKS
jgi:hypothetical protein